MNDNKKGKPVSDLEDINNHGVSQVTPPDDEYYTLDLKRGNDSDVNDLPEIDIGGNNPLNDGDEEEIVVQNILQSTSSNAGGTIRQKDIVSQNSDNGAVPGEPGHGGIDEGTG